ncbi:sugar transferase [Litoribacter alkaliphilus]|uniref:Sugar transferase n=1 Tax=Litoribacter ruber TaxID=702568 RepID=A0AAP2CHZ7_9BACT|nr:sugar transferase [Litoribacter alkaliphilus]MBS9524522.1 sugar transferase [Litoribacter alkaliphilus]
MKTRTLNSGRLVKRLNAGAKYLFDVVFATMVVFLLLSWLIPIIAVLIKLESKGPVFFKQLRTGKNNMPFYCWKFRSMVINEQADSLQASLGDPRVTRMGAFMRKTNLDELPQFINVLLGDMSIVGPRPHMIKHTRDFSQKTLNYMDRHSVKPGITGLAQVSGFRGETKALEDIENRLIADLWYIENWTMALDIKIILLTVWLSFYPPHQKFIASYIKEAA